MAYHQLKHFNRTHILGEDGYKQFALIKLPDEEGDACVTLVRCKAEAVAKEILRWGMFDSRDLNTIDGLQRGGQVLIDRQSLIVRLS